MKTEIESINGIKICDATARKSIDGLSTQVSTNSNNIENINSQLVTKATNIGINNNGKAQLKDKDGTFIGDEITIGATGITSTSSLSMGTVQTLEEGSNATATLSMNNDGGYVLNLGIPKGDKGEEGSLLAGVTSAVSRIDTDNAIVNVTLAEYNALISDGFIVKDGTTYNYNENTIYNITDSSTATSITTLKSANQVYTLNVDRTGLLVAKPVQPITDAVDTLVSKLSLSCIENSTSNSFTIKLTECPQEDVTVNLSANTDKLTITPNTVIFTPEMYYGDKTIKVIPTADSNTTNDTYNISVTANNCTTKKITVNVRDLSTARYIYNHGVWAAGYETMSNTSMLTLHDDYMQFNFNDPGSERSYLPKATTFNAGDKLCMRIEKTDLDSSSNSYNWRFTFKRADGSTWYSDFMYLKTIYSDLVSQGFYVLTVTFNNSCTCTIGSDPYYAPFKVSELFII